MRFVAAILLVLSLAGCSAAPSKPVRTIQIDTVFDAAVAKTACDIHNETRRRWAGNAYGLCENPELKARDIESTFKEAVLETPACSGVTVSNRPLANTQMPSDAFDLDFSTALNVDGDVDWKASQWQLIGSNNSIGARGSIDNTKEAAANVCHIVKGEGGKIQ